MTEDSVPLIDATNPLQTSLVEEVLREAGIHFTAHEKAAPSVIFGSTSPVGFLEIRVPETQLQEAKDALCANGIVCDVSERILERTLEEVVKPLLSTTERDYARLLHLVTINNKETVEALFRATLEFEGGRELVEDLFFAMAQKGLRELRLLARVFSENLSSGFEARFRRLGSGGALETRITLLDVLPKLPESGWRHAFLAEALLDKEAEIRDAASEALFSLKKQDYGYDPEDPPDARREAVQRFLEAAGLA